MTPASTRTRDSRTEARTGPGPLYPRNGKRPHTIQRTCDDTASWPPRRPADGQQRAALRREGDGTRSRGLISPSRRMYSTAPVRGLILLVPTRFTEVHISSPVSSMSLRAKDHLEGTKVAVSPEVLRRKQSPDRQRSGLAATEEWRPGRRRATWLPEEEQATQRDELSG